MTAQTTEWAGPARFLPPHEPVRRGDGARHFSGVTYAVAFGYRPLQMDLWVPAGPIPAPLVVWVHGGAFMMGDRRHLPETPRPGQVFDALLDAGLAVATIDYRHALEGAHGVVGPSSAVDVIVDWYGLADLETMPRQDPPPQVAALLPEELRVPPEDHLLRGLEGTTRADASPVTHVTPDAPPSLLVHGTADWLVPYAQSEQLAAALTTAGAPVELVPVAGAGHVWLGLDDVEGVVERSVRYLADALLEKDR